MISLFLSLPFIPLAIADAPSANYVTLYGQFINYTSYKHFPAAKFVEKFSNKSNWETLACNTIYCHFEDKNDCVSLCSKLMKTRTNDDPLNPRYDFEDEPECKTACGEDCWNDSCHPICSSLCCIHFLSSNRLDYEKELDRFSLDFQRAQEETAKIKPITRIRTTTKSIV